MNNWELHRESEPPLWQLLEEQKRLTREAKETREWPVDFALIQRVMRKDAEREKERHLLCQYKNRQNHGRRVKHTSL